MKSSVLDVEGLNEIIAAFLPMEQSVQVSQLSRRNRDTACIPDPQQAVYRSHPRGGANRDCDVNIYRNSTPIGDCCEEEDWMTMNNVFMLWHVRHAAHGVQDLVPAQEAASIQRFLSAAFVHANAYSLPIPAVDGTCRETLDHRVPAGTSIVQLAQQEPFLYLTGAAGRRDLGPAAAAEKDRVVLAALRGVHNIPLLRLYLGRTYGRTADSTGTRLQKELHKRCEVVFLYPYCISNYRLPSCAAVAAAGSDPISIVYVLGYNQTTVALDSVRCVSITHLSINAYLILASNLAIDDWWINLLWRTGVRLQPFVTDQPQTRLTLETGQQPWQPTEQELFDVAPIYLLVDEFMAVHNAQIHAVLAASQSPETFALTTVLVVPPALEAPADAQPCCIKVQLDSEYSAHKNSLDLKFWWHPMLEAALPAV